MRVPLTHRSELQISNRREINGCVALAWSQRLYDYHNMSFLIEASQHPELGRTYFDIGANLGPYSLILSESPDIEIHSFEPHPATARSLQSNLESNQRTNVTVHRLALSDTSGSIHFTNDDYNPTNRIVAANVQAEDHIEVPCLTGQDFCRDQGVKPDVLKIDTEGHEAEVLRGFGPLLETVKVILVEENVATADIQNALPSDAFLGPLYVHHPRRTFEPTKHAHEDAVYLNRSALPILSSLGYELID